MIHFSSVQLLTHVQLFETLWTGVSQVPLSTGFSRQEYWSVSQLSHSAVSSSLWPHGLQHTRIPCPSPTPGACSNSCPLSQSCHPTILSYIIPFSSCLQSCPASGSFQMSQFFTSGGQSIVVSASASVLPRNIHDRFLLGLTKHPRSVRLWALFPLGFM